MRKKTPSKALLSYLSHYAVFLIFFLTISLAGFFFLYNQNRKAIDQYNEAFLKQSSRIIDERFGQLKRDSTRFITDESLEENLIFDFNQIEGKLSAYDLSKVLNSLVYENPYIRHSFLFLQGVDLVITDSGLYTHRQYYELKITTPLTYEEWITRMANGADKSSSVQNTLLPEGDFESLFLFQPIPNVPKNPPLAILGFAIDEKILSNTDRGDEKILPGELSIFDSETLSLFPSNHIISQKELNMIFTEYRNQGKITEISSPTHITRINKSEERSHYYLYRFPKASYYSNLSHYWVMVGIFLLFCFLVGSVISWFFARKSGNDIWSITKSLGIKEMAEKEDPVSVITKAARELVEKNEYNELRKLFSNQSEKLSRDLMNSLGLNENDSYCALILEIEDVGYAAGNTVGPLVIRNIENDIAKESAVFQSEEEYIFCLFTDRAGIDDLLAYLRALIERLNKSYGIVLSGGVGTWHTYEIGIKKTLIEARKASAYKKYSGPGRITGFEEIGSLHNNNTFPAELKKRLLIEVKAGRTEKGQLILDQIFETCFPPEAQFYEKAETFFYEIKNMTLSLVEKTKEIIRIDQEKIKNEIYQINEILILKNYLDVLLKKMCIDIAAQKKKKMKRVDKISIIAFIEENLTNPDLDLNLAADFFSLSPYYFSTCFKEEVGRNFKDYIRTERITKAKQLLREEESLINTALKVGYANDTALFRNFKKETGQTPGFFRQYNQISGKTQQNNEEY